MLIQCIDLYCYMNPIWRGRTPSGRDWIIREDEDELCVFMEAKNKKDRSKQRLIAVVAGWPVKIGKGEYLDFTVINNEDSCKAYKFPLTIGGLLPVPTSWYTMMEHPPKDNLKYCWSVWFPTQDVREYFKKQPNFLNGKLASYMLVDDLIGQDFDYKKVRRLLYEQFKGIDKISTPAAINGYGNYVRVNRRQNYARKSSKERRKIQDS